MTCGDDRCASLFCCISACVISGCIVIVFHMLVSEISNARDDIRPVMQAALPLMQDSERISSIAIETSERLLRMAQRAYNATNLLPPAMSELMYVLNLSANTMQHMEHLTRHPVLKIDMSTA